MIFFFFLFPHCTVLHCAVKTNNKSEQRLHCTELSGTVIAQYKTFASASASLKYSEPLDVTVTFYKHVLLYFYLHNEFCWFYVLFFL